jgi:hypothetical protein
LTNAGHPYREEVKGHYSGEIGSQQQRGEASALGPPDWRIPTVDPAVAMMLESEGISSEKRDRLVVALL